MSETLRDVLALCLPTIAFIEVLLNSPLLRHARKIMALSDKSVRVLSNDYISEHWKQKALLAYARALFGNTAAAAGWVVVTVAVFGALYFICGSILIERFEFVASLSEPKTMIIATALGVPYGMLKRRPTATRSPGHPRVPSVMSRKKRP